MKKIYTLSALLFMLVLSSGTASAQMFTEDFSYTAGDSLRGHSWTLSGTSIVNALQVTTPGLTFASYPGSGIGNATHLTFTGQDLYRSFVPDSIGSVYASFMISVDSVIATGDYFFAMSLGESQTSYYARTFIKATSAGFSLGVSKNNETPQSYGTSVLSFGKTYLVVVKYTFVAGNNNDLVTLYVFPQGASIATEPATPEVGPYNGSAVGDARNIGIATLRQGGGSGVAPSLSIDGIRVDSTWKGLLSVPVVTIGEARKDLNNNLIADHSVTKDTLKIYGVVVSPNYGASYPQLSYFIQDATGGIDLFGYTLPATPLDIGDSVYAVGTVAQYKGLVEFTPGAMDLAHFGVIKKNAVVPAPKRLTLHQFVTSAESYEGQLIEIDTLYKATGTWPAAAANTSIYVTNAAKTDTAQMFLDFDVNIFGPADPLYPINVVGIVSQYASSTANNNGYEIMPRGLSDITPIKVTGVESIASGLPKTFELMNNFPNPFNPTTQIRFALPQASMAKLVVYDMLGREVRTLVNGRLDAGYFESRWDGTNSAGVHVASGMYIYRMEAGSFVSSKKMMLLK